MDVDQSTYYPQPSALDFDDSFSMFSFLPALFHEDGSLRESDMPVLEGWPQWSSYQ